MKESMCVYMFYVWCVRVYVSEIVCARARVCVCARDRVCVRVCVCVYVRLRLLRFICNERGS
jgi:hypothetical protein